jgi:S-layer homology domain
VTEVSYNPGNPCLTATLTATPAPTNTPLPIPTTQPTVCPNPFVDINTNIFFHAINYLYCHGDINGTDATHYSPALTSSRAQFAKVVVLGFGTPFYTPATPDFTDVPPSYFAYTFIESGYHAGILGGFDPAGCTSHGATYPCYLPNLPITRGQLTKLVVNAAHYTLVTPGTQTFSDVPPSNVFYIAIETAHAKGVINGYPDGTFRPNNNIRRDEMAQIVYKGVTTP